MTALSRPVLVTLIVKPSWSPALTEAASAVLSITTAPALWMPKSLPVTFGVVAPLMPVYAHGKSPPGPAVCGAEQIQPPVLPPLGGDVPLLGEALGEFKVALARCRAAEAELQRVMSEGGWLE